MLGLFSYLGKPIHNATSRSRVKKAHGRTQDVAEQLLMHKPGGPHGALSRQDGCKEQEESCKESTERSSPAHGDTGRRHPLAQRTHQAAPSQQLLSKLLRESCIPRSWEAPVTVSHHSRRTLTLLENLGPWHYLQTG